MLREDLRAIRTEGSFRIWLRSQVACESSSTHGSKLAQGNLGGMFLVAEACWSFAGRVGATIEDLVDETPYQEMIVTLPMALEVSEDIVRLSDGYDMLGYGCWQVLGNPESTLRLILWQRTRLCSCKRPHEHVCCLVLS